MDPLALDSWTLLLFVAAAGVVLAFLPLPPLPRWLQRAGEGWILPAVAGVASAIVVRYLWGSFDPAPFIHDEASYLLQAQMLGHGHWVEPARPLPEFFEQFHVFVTPVLASRYPPGWGLALVPGVWLGLPIVVPLLLTGLTAALLVILVRRLAGPAAALCAWSLWIGATIELKFRATFLSAHLSVFCWALAWWALLRWREDRRARWMALLAVAIAWDGITRPLTALALALPIGGVVLVDVWRTRRFRELALGIAAGLAVCTLVPIQDAAVMGRWNVMPMVAYSRIYTPYEKLGFGLDATHPLVAPTPERKAYGDEYRPFFAQHAPDLVPQLLESRGTSLMVDSAGRWGALGLTLLVILGLVANGAPIALAGLDLAALFLAYLWYGHPPQWTVYYLEGHLVIAAAAALGARRALGWIARAVPRLRASTEEHRARWRSAALCAIAVWALLDLPFDAQVAKVGRAIAAQPNESMQQILRHLPPRSILFIRYRADHVYHRDLIDNPDDLGAAVPWRVLDLGPHNADLIRLAPDRTPFLFDEGSWTVRPLGPDGTLPGSPAPLPARME